MGSCAKGNIEIKYSFREPVANALRDIKFIEYFYLQTNREKNRKFSGVDLRQLNEGLTSNLYFLDAYIKTWN